MKTLSRRTQTPKRVLRLPDLDYAKGAVLKTLLSRNRSAPMNSQLTISSPGTAGNRGWGKRAVDCATGSNPRADGFALLLGCGLRRGEVADLRVDHLQQREDHWLIADLIGKAAHIRSVPVPDWVKSAVALWLEAASCRPTINAARARGCVAPPAASGTQRFRGAVTTTIWRSILR